MNINDRRSAPAAAALLVLALAGCGSSGGSSGTSGASDTTTGRTAAKSSAGAPGLKVDTTPKFASPSKSDPVQSGTVHIAYRYITIQPDTLRVKVGTTVVWTDYDSVKDDVTSVGGPQRIASRPFGEGKSFSVKLTRPGIVHYESTPYPTTMNGSIEVVR
jgi:plastocyanin